MHLKRFSVTVFILISWCMAFTAQAQKATQIELLHADFADFDQTISSEIQRLSGNVSFRHENAFMYCDSAYLNKVKNSLEAFSHVRITKGDSVTLTGKSK